MTCTRNSFMSHLLIMITPITSNVSNSHCQLYYHLGTSSATTLDSIWNTWVFRMALTALMEPHTLWRRITRYPLHCIRTSFTMWWRIRIIRMTCVLHSSQGLQLCWRRLYTTWWCLCLSPAQCHTLPLRYCYISDAALSPYVFSFEMMSLVTIQSSLRIHRLPLHLLCHYRILQVWNILSNLHTL